MSLHPIGLHLLTLVQLFYTIGHLRAGEEEAFPAPDNLQKMRRSVDNAESVGLYKTRNYSPPSRTSARRFPSAPATAVNQPARVHPAQSGSGVAALSSPGVQALINPRTTLATPVTAPAIYKHPLYFIQSGPAGMDVSRATPPATPYESRAVPMFSPAAPPSLSGPGYNTDFTPSLPKISEDTPTRVMVNTRSPFDPFRGRADADTSENTHFIPQSILYDRMLISYSS